MNVSKIDGISDTAFWVGSYRAKESTRKDALFLDPFAELLAGQKGFSIAESVTDSKYVEWTVVIRTRVIDEMIKALLGKGITMVANLGAGLDTRPYRLQLPNSLLWVEVDHPHLVAFKEEKLNGKKPVCQLERYGLDLSLQEQREELFLKLNSIGRPCLILTEGVVPYLTEAQAKDLAAGLLKCSNFQYWIVEYHSKEMYRHLNNQRKNLEMGNSPFQFFPDNWLGFFAEQGWKEHELLYLGEEAKKLGRPFPLPWWAKTLFAVLPKEHAERVARMSGFVVLRKS